MLQAGLAPGAGNGQCVITWTAPSPGICKLGPTTMTLEVGLGSRLGLGSVLYVGIRRNHRWLPERLVYDAVSFREFEKFFVGFWLGIRIYVHM